MKTTAKLGLPPTSDGKTTKLSQGQTLLVLRIFRFYYKIQRMKTVFMDEDWRESLIMIEFFLLYK